MDSKEEKREKNMEKKNVYQHCQACTIWEQNDSEIQGNQNKVANKVKVTECPSDLQIQWLWNDGLSDGILHFYEIKVSKHHYHMARQHILTTTR